MQALVATSGLTARDLCCRRGDRWLFAGLGLDLAPGQALHLAGPNGIGKTSLLRMLAGLLTPSPSPRNEHAPGHAGTIAWQGGIGLLDERLALDPGQPLGAALGFWARIDNVPATALADTLGLLGLAALVDVPVRYLSTGQRKRTAFARLLGQRAGNWLLDEPLNGLDTAGTALVERLVERHRTEGGVAIVASHQPFDLPGAERLDLGERSPEGAP